MRRRLAIHGATDEAVALVPLLEANPTVSLVAVYDPDVASARERLRALGDLRASQLASLLTDDPGALGQLPLDAVIETGGTPVPFARRFPEAAVRGVQIVSALTARLLWGYGRAVSEAPARERKTDLLQALREVVESVNLTVDPDELFARMLEIALGVTGADRGSLMLLDAEAQELTVCVAVGIERELWPKIRVPLGQGIAGRVAAEARPLRLRGRADRDVFRIVRERLDVESALCVPLVHEGKVLGVLNLHHSTRADAFSDADLAFAEQLGALDAQILYRAQEHAQLRDQAQRYRIVRAVREAISGPEPLETRLARLCRLVAERTGRGIATVYLNDADAGELRLAATSLTGGGFGGEYRVAPGQGIDGRAAEERRAAFLRGENGALAYAALPLVSGDTFLGVLSVQAGSAPLGGRGAEEMLLEMAAAAADEIAQAEREARISSHATKVSAVNETGIRMITARDPADVVRLATSSAAMVLEADHAILRLQDETTGRWVIRSYFGSADGRAQERLFRLDKRVAADAIQRRATLAVRDVSEAPALRELARELGTGVRSLLAAPLRQNGAVIGTLALYDKVSPERFAPSAFHEEDVALFGKLVSYVERALANALFYARAHEHRSFDDDTGLPNAAYLAKRLDEELARAAGRPGAFALATCRIESWDAIRACAPPGFETRVARRIADALRARVRDFDVVARSGERTFVVLLPEPGAAPDERVAALARAVFDDVRKHEPLDEPARLVMAFGYAVLGVDGTTREALLARAREPRIHRV